VFVLEGKVPRESEPCGHDVGRIDWSLRTRRPCVGESLTLLRVVIRYRQDRRAEKETLGQDVRLASGGKEETGRNAVQVWRHCRAWRFGIEEAMPLHLSAVGRGFRQGNGKEIWS